MKSKHFHEAYKRFMLVVVKKIQSLPIDLLKRSDECARRLIKEHFDKTLQELQEREKKKKLNEKYPPLKTKKN
jgi:hypothetical protein